MFLLVVLLEECLLLNLISILENFRLKVKKKKTRYFYHDKKVPPFHRRVNGIH
jgi:hypothetical protein